MTSTSVLSTEHFAILGLQPKIVINHDDLENQYIRKQQEFSDNIEMQNQLNQSYKLIKNDSKRLEYFLQMSDFQLKNEIDSESLMEFYEINEELEGLSIKKKKQKIQQTKHQIKDYLSEIENLLEKNDPDPINQIVVKVKYLNRIIENN